MTDVYEKQTVITDRQSFAQQLAMLLNIRGMTHRRFADATGLTDARARQMLCGNWSTPDNLAPTDDELTNISKALDIEFSRLDGWLACDFITMARYKSQFGISDKTQAEKDARRERWTEVARQEAEAKGIPFVSTAAEHKDRKERKAAERQGLLKAA